MIKRLLLMCCLFGIPLFAIADEQEDPLISIINARQAETTVEQNTQTPPPTDAVDVVFKALSLVGTPYRYGGNNPDQGFDCSGFVNYVFYNAFGIKLPRTAAEIGQRGDTIAKDNLQVGDLVFFNTMRRSFSHVGIYIGEGLFIHAPSSGSSVRMDNLNDRYWTKRYEGARRFLSGF